MAVQHLTYLDIPPSQRREAAAAARKRLHEHLSNPFLSPEQARTAHEKLTALDRWEAGQIHVRTATKPVQHSVALSDDVRVTDGGKRG